jgi:Zn-dependent protease with chaperone function
MTPKVLTGLRPQAYEHPKDAAALNALQKTAGFGTIVSKINALGVDRILRTQLTGSHLRVTADSFPDLYEVLITACRTLDHRVVPDLYITEGAEINAFTTCVEQPLIAVSSGAVSHLSEQELLFVIAHEVGHIKSGHVLYYQIASTLWPVVGELAATIPAFGDAIKMALNATVELALLYWQRMSELTADRAGLLACQDANGAFMTMAKLSGLPRKYYDTYNSVDFINQARAFKAMDLDWGSRIVKVLTVMSATHPWTVMRAQELLNWSDSGSYQHVIDNPTQPGRGVAGPKIVCPLGHPLHGGEKFCNECGTRVA